MLAFSRLTSVAAVMRETDIDTDVIFPARFLLLPDKTGLGRHLFHERRRRPGADGLPFVLDRPPFDEARILVAGANFGCGSSREQSVWALADFGIGCVIAPSFGEIFQANCFKNGVLPIVVADEPHRLAMEAGESGSVIGVDLDRQVLTLPGGRSIAFSIDAFRRRALLLGLDEIGAIISEDLDDIRRFEAAQRQAAPWLHLGPDKLAAFADLGKETALE